MSTAYLQRFGCTTALAFALGLLLPIGPLWAGATQADLQRCASIIEGGARLACFDELVSEPVPATQPEPEAPVRNQPSLEQQLAAEQQKARQLQTELEETRRAQRASKAALLAPSQEMLLAAFGAEQLPAHERPPIPEQQLAEIEAVVSELSVIQNGWIRVRLDNGQVWQQNSAGRALRLRSGPEQKVVIKRGWLSSYRLRNPDNNIFITVERIK